MSARFPLAPVLRVRAMAAEREERLLAQIAGELARLRQAMLRIDLELARTAQVREQALAGAMRAAHLQTSYGLGRELRETRRQMEQQLSRLEEAREAQVTVCEAAYREREVLASMRDAHRSACMQARGKREQKQADEAFLSRFTK